MDDLVRFRIKPQHVEDVLAMLASAGIEPVRIQHRDAEEVAIEIKMISDQQGRLIATSFRPEWSAIIGLYGGIPPVKGQ
ncbi:hypothetical protein ASE73_06940 [Sphingomonas sp. Leaf24]|uniref:hypothetical protein n=1 Tax=unclassified Sphingomonas TaxID=196159 RepID=UPI0006FA5F63|nr:MULTISPECIES: hypothetical protein [unclassified Sphingomonas]KQM18573.1 hypothetical protein ASE50_05455 [Sphingomonas sp. Leaf5]KQM89334.1 hypothetical protein ASE73_06940 [Sphingomonas sp. Leaf24]